MKNTHKGFVGILAVILIALIAIGGGAYIYLNQENLPDISGTQIDISSVLSGSTSSGQVANNINSNAIGLTDDQFLSAVGNDAQKTEIVARGDINKDGYEDVIVQQMYCGASCSFSLSVVFNINNKSARLLVNSANTYVAFGPAYYGSSAMKSSVSGFSIKDGIVLLTGQGLCFKQMKADFGCEGDDWYTTRTVQYKYDGTNLVQISPVPAAYIVPKIIDPIHISIDEINNHSYERPSINVNSNLHFTTYTNGLYQSPKITCNGANTCPEGQYAFSEISKVAFNTEKTSAAVVMASTYASTLDGFHQAISKNGAEAVDVYLLGKSGSIIDTKPFSLGWGFQANNGLKSLIVTGVQITGSDIITVYAHAKKNDGNGNFKDIDLVYQFRLENDVLVLQ